MLAAPSKEHLPAHSRDVCPWGKTCSVHAKPTFADMHERRWLKRDRNGRYLPRKFQATHSQDSPGRLTPTAELAPADVLPMRGVSA